MDHRPKAPAVRLSCFSLTGAGYQWVWWLVIYAIFVTLNWVGAETSFRFAQIVSIGKIARQHCAEPVEQRLIGAGERGGAHDRGVEEDDDERADAEGEDAQSRRLGDVAFGVAHLFGVGGAASSPGWRKPWNM